jgi:hypothetical protein
MFERRRKKDHKEKKKRKGTVLLSCYKKQKGLVSKISNDRELDNRKKEHYFLKK